MAISNLPTPPTRSDPVNFNSRADAFLSALPTFATEANTLQADVNAKQTAAATSATNASASELAAAANSAATAWVSGTTYAIGNVRYSPITYLAYRRKTAGAGTTDPSADATNWVLVNGVGNVDLTSTQTLTNKTHSTGSVWNGTAVPVANGGTGATTAAAAFTAIKQAASDTASGVVELATVSEVQTGTDTTRAVTSAGVEAHLIANGLGWGQTWQDVEVSRAFATTYTNSTGRPIEVLVSATSTTNGAITLNIIVDGITVGTNRTVPPTGFATTSFVSAIVPNGSTYSATHSGMVSYGWKELR